MTETELSKHINNEESKENYEAALESSKELYKHLKKTLKMRSKSQLVHIIVTYSDQLTEMQNIAQQLLEENKLLKESKND